MDISGPNLDTIMKDPVPVIELMPDRHGCLQKNESKPCGVVIVSSISIELLDNILINRLK